MHRSRPEAQAEHVELEPGTRTDRAADGEEEDGMSEYGLPTLEKDRKKLERLEADLIEREGDVGRVKAALYRLSPHVPWDYSRAALAALDRIAEGERTA
jgi:hypothetical protein